MSNYMRDYGATREDFGKLAVAQRDNALRNPHALMKKPLTLDDYMNARRSPTRSTCSTA
jgi:acetyl-CoA acetyltransferase